MTLRKKQNNPLMRVYWKKADPNDSSITACYKLRFPENKSQKKKKNKNLQSLFLKIKALRKEIVSGRSLLINVMKREKLKQQLVDLEYMEAQQMIKEINNPDYQCQEFYHF